MYTVIVAISVSNRIVENTIRCQLSDVVTGNYISITKKMRNSLTADLWRM